MLMGLYGFFSNKKVADQKAEQTNNRESSVQTVKSVSYDNQIEIFKTLGYQHDKEVTKEMIMRDVFEMTWEDETEKHIEANPFTILYYSFGRRDPGIKNHNYSNKCLWFDLEFFDPSSQYKWFMERLGAITNGELKFEEISIETDSENYEWIRFKVNGQQKRWKLEKSGYIAGHFVQRFSYLPSEFKTKGRYTYYDNGGQQWVIDYATEDEQVEFNKVTGLNREWLGEGNHFSEPPKE